MPVVPQPEQRRVSFSEALRFWIKLGFISFGGPAGQIAIMHRELVEKRRWLGEERFLHALNYCMLLPGPEAQQLAVYIGWLMHRTAGGIVAGAFFVIPSIFILLTLSYIYAAYGNVPLVIGVLNGFKPVVVAIVIEALFKIGKRALKRWVHYAIAALAFAAIYALHVPFPLIVLSAAVVGYLGTKFLPEMFSAPAATKGEKPGEEQQTSLHDDAAEMGTADIGRYYFVKVAAAGAILWLLPFAVLVLMYGGNGFYVAEYKFFSVAALVTFGGAYAVLAYVTQAVTQAPYLWLTPSQAIDGLALAETTPGPLIMVLQFIGFMAGWNNPPGGMSQAVGGVIGALIATYTTFLPSFLFIFLGAPYIERVRGNKPLAGALTGVTSAVVGVILNLAIVFGLAVIIPDGTAGGIRIFPAVMTAAAFAALTYLKVDVLWVVPGGGILGLIWTLSGGS